MLALMTVFCCCRPSSLQPVTDGSLSHGKKVVYEIEGLAQLTAQAPSRQQMEQGECPQSPPFQPTKSDSSTVQPIAAIASKNLQLRREKSLVTHWQFRPNAKPKQYEVLVKGTWLG